MIEPDLPTRDLGDRVRETIASIRARTALVPRVGITLGSGLGGVIDAIDREVVFPTAELPHWPRSTVSGHAGRLALGHGGGVPVVLLAGRSHRYEGYTLDRVTYAVRVMEALGARTMLFTNAVGAIHPELRPGDLLLATDHLNFIGRRGLFDRRELAERRAGRRVSTYYDLALRDRIRAAAARARIPLRLGTLMGGLGPSYETAAEVRLGSLIGADVACMSTVHEVTVAAELGCACASISCVTNRATGLSDGPLSHDEVTEVANRVAAQMGALLAEFLRAESQ
jgi:purine-nucleoside phosphorylase